MKQIVCLDNKSNPEYMSFKKFAYKSILLYVISYLLFIVCYNKYVPSISHLFIQGLFVVAYSFLYVYSLRKSIAPQQFFMTLFYCIFIQIIILRVWNIVIYENPLGYNPIDSIGYDEFARTFTINKFEIWDIFDYLNKSNESIDDYGFNTIISITYKIFGSEIGIWALAIFNAFAWIIGCYFLYKLTFLFYSNNTDQRFVTLLWGCFSYSIFTAATGLKENFFCCVVIFTMYRLYKYISRKSAYNMLLFFLGAIGCSLFRLALIFIFFLIFIFVISFT